MGATARLRAGGAAKMGRVVVFADGSIGGAGWRAEIDGRPVAQGGVVVQGTSNVAEYEGVLGALEWLRKHRYFGAEIRADSRLVIEQVAGRWRTEAPHLIPLRDQARKLVGETGARLMWVPSSQNAAHDVARDARPQAPVKSMLQMSFGRSSA